VGEVVRHLVDEKGTPGLPLGSGAGQVLRAQGPASLSVQSGQNLKAADILLKVAQIASALRNPMRERGAVFLLSQAQGRLRNYEAALQWSQRTLQLTQELKLEQLYAADIYWVAFYQLQLGRFTEAQSLFGKAAERAPADNPGLLREIHFYSGVSALRIGEKSGATRSFREALRHAQATKDWSKIMQASEHLADMEFERGDKNAAARLLQDALKAAEQGNLREERKGIRKKLDEISG
jgi:tetratricopeptide (TPR) repeat protein